MLKTIFLLICSNLFMTYAWYGHLKNQANSKLWLAVLFSWSIAFFEYCFQVPANRIGFNFFSIGQLKVLQEIISMTIFALFSIYYLKIPLTKNFAYASVCLVLAAFFIFKEKI